MNSGNLHKVWEIKALKKPGHEQAKEILEKIAKQVQPIMRKRAWRVKVLSEFCPQNRALLGLNVGGGLHVKLRLRRPNRDWDFFPFEQVLDTMLHELCHNVHGPHNASFYKLWDELRKECQDLMEKGITGSAQGFDLPGRRLGGFSRQPPLSSLRKTALDAAERRARLGSLLPSGPKHLGGDTTIMAALSPIQAAAMAAERRRQDDIWCSQEASVDEECCSDTSAGILNTGQSVSQMEPCGNSSRPEMDAISRKRSREPDGGPFFQFPKSCSKLGFVDLSSDSSSSEPVTSYDIKSTKRSFVSGEMENSLPRSCTNSGISDVSTSSPDLFSNDNDTGPLHPGEPAMWECGSCTLLNPPLALVCEVCGTQKPRDAEIKYKFWSCKFCTLENSVKLEKCAACDQWRYSRGPPVSTWGPNVGT